MLHDVDAKARSGNDENKNAKACIRLEEFEVGSAAVAEGAEDVTLAYTGPIFDADTHLWETADAFTRYLPKDLK